MQQPPHPPATRAAFCQGLRRPPGWAASATACLLGCHPPSRVPGPDGTQGWTSTTAPADGNIRVASWPVLPWFHAACVLSHCRFRAYAERLVRRYDSHAMKIILSRKGFDSGYGGCPSPVFPDGSMVSLPIPGGRAPNRFGGIQGPAGPLGPLAAALSRRPAMEHAMAHLDPDLDAGSVPRRPGWRPSLGQVGAAQSHLAAQGVGPGDVFLFFGWFRPIEPHAGAWHYVRGQRALHAMFGYLQVGEVMALGADPANHARQIERTPWLHDHPHLNGQRAPNNTLYVAADRLTLPGLQASLPGAGCFASLSDDLVLTAPGQSVKSVWRLPDWMSPETGATLSYHADAGRWSRDPAGNAILRSVAKGQEFVMDVATAARAMAWLQALLARPLRNSVPPMQPAATHRPTAAPR